MPPKEDLLREISADARMTRAYTGQAEISAAVMEALRQVPRDAFIPEDAAAYAWENRPLPIGHGQTISQPFIVALMTDLLAPESSHRVLEIGTGSGYQAAVLAELVETVNSVEIIPELAEAAAATLNRLGYDNVSVRVGDGWHGWPDDAPYDGIIVTAVSPDVPPALVDQLAPAGRLVMPLGDPHGSQMLVVVTNAGGGELNRRDVLPVQFVPLTGDH